MENDYSFGIKDVEVAEKPNEDGTYTVSIDFVSTKAERAFRKMVREYYNQKRYSTKLGSKFIGDALTALCVATEVKVPETEQSVSPTETIGIVLGAIVVAALIFGVVSLFS